MNDYTSSIRLYWPNICVVCSKKEDLIFCEKCKMITYCSERHKSKDIRNHLAFCKIIQDNPMSSFKSTPRDYINYCVNNWPQSKAYHQINLIGFPNLCVVCNKQENLYFCKNCNSVGFCSVRHELNFMKSHLMYCELLKICYLVDKYDRLYTIDYFDVRKTKKCLNDFLNTLQLLKLIRVRHSKLLGSDVMDDLNEKEVIMCCSLKTCNKISPVASLLNLSSIFTKKYMNVHVIWKYNDSQAAWAILGGLLNMFFGTSFVYISITDMNEKDITENVVFPYCYVEYYTDNYVDVCFELGEPEVIYYNLVRSYEEHLLDTYLDTIWEMVRRSRAMLLLTAPYEQILTNALVHFLTQFEDVDIIVAPTKNKFKDYRPWRNLLHRHKTFSNPQVYYQCEYYMILTLEL